jgi:hypothetical protein
VTDPREREALDILADYRRGKFSAAVRDAGLRRLGFEFVRKSPARHKYAPGEVVQTRRARSTGTLVTVKRADVADDPAGSWETVCEAHSTVCAHSTLTLARYHAPAPEGWCEVCARANDDPEGGTV